MSFPLDGIVYVTALVAGGFTLGAYLNGSSQADEERRAREMAGLQTSAAALTAETERLRDLVARQQEAAVVEEGLGRRVEHLTGVLVQMQAFQRELGETVDARVRELADARRDREAIEVQLQAARRACEERDGACAKVNALLLAAQAENRQLNAALTEVQRGGEGTRRELAALRAAHERLTEASDKSRRTCEELTRALATATGAAEGMEAQLAQLRSMYEGNQREIVRLGDTVTALQRNRRDDCTANSSARAVSTKKEEDPELQEALRRSLEEMDEKFAGEEDLDPDTLAVIVLLEEDEANERAIASSVSSSGAGL